MKRLYLPWSITGSVVMGMAAGICQALEPGAAGMFYRQPQPTPPLGTNVDSFFRLQESNAEASKFVVYQHEFRANIERLNLGGEDHVKQIAMKILDGAQFPVLVERSMTSVDADTKYQFPVNENVDLDLHRRRVIVRALVAMGVSDAEQRVVVSPALATPYIQVEAARAYRRAIISGGAGGGGFGGGGFGGFGGFR